MIRATFTSALLLVAAAFLVDTSHAQQNGFYLHDGDRVVFYGDSITEQRNYSMIIETYVLTRYPNLRVLFTNSGWGGDRVSGGGGGDIDVRLKRDVTPYQPTVVTIMLGMNDGGYKAATEESDKQFFDGFRHIVTTLGQADPQARITAIEPSPYDDTTRRPAFPVMDGTGYNQVLVGYGKWISTYAKENHITVADANTDFVHVLDKANETDPSVAKEILPDHIHPSFGGHLLIAESILKAWQARSVVASVKIQAGALQPKLVQAEHTTVQNLTGGNSIGWSETDDALPLPFLQWQQMWGGGPTIGLAIGSSDLTAALNQEPLCITGLKSGVYALRIDGTSIGTFTSDQFASGINLALLKTPMSEQAMSVYQLTTQRGDLHYDRWRHIQVPFGDVAEGQEAMTKLDAVGVHVEEQQRKAALPKAHVFEVALIQ